MNKRLKSRFNLLAYACSSINKRLLTIVILLFFTYLNSYGATYDWKGTVNSDWNTGGNWSGGTVPVATDAVQIGVVSFTNQPVINSYNAISFPNKVASITFGATANVILTVNATFNLIVTGNITKNHSASNGTSQSTITGAGIITCQDLNIGTVSTPANGSSPERDSTVVSSSIGTFNILGNMRMLSYASINGYAVYYPAFHLDANDVILAGSIITTNNGNAASSSYLSQFVYRGRVTINNANFTNTLTLTNTSPIAALAVNQVIDFNNIGSVNATVIYNALTNGQNVYTSADGIGSVGGNYQNLTLSGGNKIVHGSNLTISGNLTTSGAGSVNLNTNNPVITIGKNWTNATNVTQGSGNISVTNDFTNTSGTLALGSGTFNITGNMNINSGTVSGGSGAVAVTGAFNNTGVYTGATGALTITQAAVNGTGGSFTAGSGVVTFNSNYTNATGGSFQCGTGNVFYNGNYTNSGNFTAGTGTVYFNRSGAQTLVDNSTGKTVFNYVNFQNSGVKTMSGTGGFAVSPNSLLTMGGSASLAAGGVLTLRSDATGSASVAVIPATCSITGNVNVERYVAGGDLAHRGYRLLSSPVTQTTLGGQAAYGFKDLQLTAPITGYNTTGTYTAAAPANAFDASAQSNPTVFFYYEPDPDPASKIITKSDYKGLSSINDVIPMGNGVLFFFRGNRNITDLPGTNPKTSISAIPENTTLKWTGNLNQGTVNVYVPTSPIQTAGVNKVYVSSAAGTSLSSNITSTANPGPNNGLHIVGNPFASTIDLELITLNNFGSNSIYMLNNAGVISAYQKGSPTGTLINGVGRYVVSGQGFFIVANTAGTTTLSFPEACKVPTTPLNPTSFQIKRADRLAATKQTVAELQQAEAVNTADAKPQELVIRLALDSVNANEALIGFGSKTNKYDPFEDAYYRYGLSQTTFMASYSSDAKPLLINQMGSLDSIKTIPLYAEGQTSGLYTLKFTGAASVDPRYKLLLMDYLKKDSLDLSANDTYNFNIDRSNAKTYGDSRFALVVRPTHIAAYYHLNNFTGAKSTDGVLLSWTTQYEGDYTGFTLQRSNDNGKSFTGISSFQSDGKGSYRFLDTSPAAGTSLYRLVQNNADNVNSFSNIVTISYQPLNQIITKFEVFPNPATSTVQLKVKADAMPGALSVKIYNMAGLLMISSKLSTSGSLTQDVSRLQQGNYVIHVTDSSNKPYGTTSFTKK